MHTLRVLGGAWIEEDGRRLTGAAAQRHRVALLARLATAPDATLPREVLATLLWPEHGRKESRHLLNQSVHVLRRALGDDVLLSLGHDLRLDTDRMACDVVAFREALERDDVEAALALYAGPFTDGFFLDDAAEFDQWQALERDRLSRGLVAALEASAEAAEAVGDHRTARDRWRRLVDEEPYAATFTLRLMRALEAAGDRGGALQAAQEHTDRLAREFDAEPHPEVAALAERMRARPAPAALPGPPDPSPRVAPATGPPATRPRPVDPLPGGARQPVVALGAGLAVVAGASVVFLAPPPPDPASVAETPPLASVAVLPFQDFSEGGGNAYLSDGITEELLNALAGIPGLHVPSRSSSFQFRSGAFDIGEVARRLRVANVVEGSVRRDGERVRVTAQLIDATTGYHLWSREYDRPLTDLLATEEEIARAIAGALRVQLERRGALLSGHAGADPRAYDLYLRGRWAWNRRSSDAMLEARDAFEAALAIDPDYAPAWTGLADTWQLLPDYGAIPAREGLARARTAALRAVALDSMSGEAYASLGHSLDDYDRDRAAAGAAYRRAIELSPGYATAHQWYGLHLANGGRFDEALAELERARRLDPLSPIINTAVGAVLYFQRDYPRAVAEYRAVVERNPRFAVGWALLGRVHLVAGSVDEAVRTLRRAVDLSGGDASYRAVLASALAEQGDSAGARAIVEDLLAAAPGGYVPYSELAPALLRLGEVDRALALYERGWDERDTAVKHLFVEPLHDPIRGHPRFDALVARLGLPEG